MVGGEGRRLRPLTYTTPKSLLRVGHLTILEHMLLLLRRFGIHDVTLAVNYLASMIEDRLRTGEELGVRIRYQREAIPLGTAGALSLLDGFDETTLMMNGDILTDLNIEDMLESHRAHGAVLSVASKIMHTDLSLGVLDVQENGLVAAYREKPRLEHRFGIGVYLVEPIVKSYIREGERVDVPELIGRLLSDRQKVACYEHTGQWTDIGLPEDYARIQKEAERMEIAALHSHLASEAVLRRVVPPGEPGPAVAPPLDHVT